MQALKLAETFRAQFRSSVVMNGATGASKFRVELSAPDGPSTAGGKLAIQHVKLIPEDGGATIVAGWANAAERIAELRAYEHLETVYAQRFSGAVLPIDRRHYTTLLGRLQNFFKSFGLAITFVEAPRPDMVSTTLPLVERSPKPTLIILLALLGLVIVAAVASYVLQHRILY